MSDKVEVSKQMIANIHNAVATMRPTGEDIIKCAAVMMDLRKILGDEEEAKEE